MATSSLHSELDDLLDVVGKLSSLSKLMAEAGENIPDSVTVEDDTGMLQLTVLRDGSIEDFQMESDWKDEIDPEDLGDVLTALVSEGMRELLGDADAFLLENLDEGGLEDDDLAVDDEAVERVQDDADSLVRQAQERGPVLRQQAEERAEEFIERSLDALNAGEPLDDDVVSDEGVDDIVCQSSGGTVTRVVVNDAWARTTPTAAVRQRIAEELAEASGDSAPMFGFGDGESGEVLLDMLQLLGNSSSGRE